MPYTEYNEHFQMLDAIVNNAVGFRIDVEFGDIDDCANHTVTVLFDLEGVQFECANKKTETEDALHDFLIKFDLSKIGMGFLAASDIHYVEDCGDSMYAVTYG
jgi:hypothetical protein